MVKDLISVVMPTYNDAQYLTSAIEDILNQTYDNFELIIVNDGSTDNTSDILEKYSKKDKRIKIHNKENGGTGSALNYGFKKATGEFGTWISSDDNKEVDFLKTLVTFLKSNRDIEYVCSAYYSTFLKSVFKAYHKFNNEFRYCGGLNHDSSMTGESFIVDDWCLINSQHSFQGVCFMFTMRLKNVCGEYIEIPGEDYHMSMKMGLKSRVGYVDTVLGKHNNPQDSISMMDRRSTLKAENLTKQMFQYSEKWKLSIPKIASFFCDEQFSEEEKKSIVLFKKTNPDWSVHIYKNLTNTNPLLSSLEEEIACLIKNVNMDSLKVTSHKISFLSCYILISQGGLWISPKTKVGTSLNTLCDQVKDNIDTLFCYDESYSPDFILSKPRNEIFKKMLSFIKKEDLSSISAKDIYHKCFGSPQFLAKEFNYNNIYLINTSSSSEETK